jgi:hypothetical protein
MWINAASRGLPVVVSVALAGGVMAEPPAHADTLDIACTSGHVDNTFTPGFTLIPQMQHDNIDISAGNCTVMVDGLGPGFEKGKVLSLQASYVAEGLGQCVPLGMPSIQNSPVEITWSNGQHSIASADPYSIGLLNPPQITGKVTDGAVAGGHWATQAAVDAGKAVTDAIAGCWNSGIRNFALTTKNFDLYDVPPAPAAPPAPPAAVPGQRPSADKGDGGTPGTKEYIPGGRPAHVTTIIRNAGDLALNSITVTDGTASPNARLVNPACENTSLQPGQSTTCSAEVTVPAGTTLNDSAFVFVATTPRGSKIRLTKDFYTAANPQ